MTTSFLYKIFGIGRTPRDARSVLEGEGIALLQEGLWGSVTFRNFKAPGRRHGFKKSGFVGSVVLSKKTLAGFAFSRQVVGVSLDDTKIQDLSIGVERGSTLLIAFEASDFQEGASGQVECRWRMTQAQQFIDQIRQRSNHRPG